MVMVLGLVGRVKNTWNNTETGIMISSSGYLRSSCLISICIGNPFPVDWEFLISEPGPSLLGLNILRKLRVNFSLPAVQHGVSDVLNC